MSKVFIRRKKGACGQTHGWAQRESCPRGSLNHLYGAFLLGFLWPIILLCLALSPYLVYLRVLLCVRASLSQDAFYQRGLWQVDITYYGVAPPPFLTLEEPFCACVVWKVSLPSRMRNMWSFTSYLGRAQLLLPPAILEYLSTRDKLQLLSLGPIYLLPQYEPLEHRSHLFKVILTIFREHLLGVTHLIRLLYLLSQKILTQTP